MNKYHAKKIQTEDGVFDSRREYSRWCALKLLQRAGMIRDLRRQVAFLLIPAQRDQETGKLIEHDCRYVADFVYVEDDKTVVEDAKGVRTKEYIIKRKLMLKQYGLRIREV